MASAPAASESALLEQRIALLEQGMEQAAKVRDLWAKAVKDLKATRTELKNSVEALTAAHEELAERNEALEDLNSRLREEMEIRERMEAELRLAQKLESIGQLAAGMAHEINTPIQYIADNTLFIQSSFEAFQLLLAELEAEPSATGTDEEGRLAAALGVVTSEDLLGLAEDMPDAISETLEGIEQVASIVSSLKEFSHQGLQEKAPVDVNRALQTTATVARSEWTDVADIEWQLLDGLSDVYAVGAELNQVFLNLLVNAAQAIDAAEGNASGQGRICISTDCDAAGVTITMKDNGVGIPLDIRDQIFDPFFSTKDVGVGSGQGLSTARSIVVDHHGGTIDVSSEEGVGTTFTIWLPIKPPS